MGLGGGLQSFALQSDGELIPGGSSKEGEWVRERASPAYVLAPLLSQRLPWGTQDEAQKYWKLLQLFTHFSSLNKQRKKSKLSFASVQWRVSRLLSASACTPRAPVTQGQGWGSKSGAASTWLSGCCPAQFIFALLSEFMGNIIQV